MRTLYFGIFFGIIIGSVSLMLLYALAPAYFLTPLILLIGFVSGMLGSEIAFKLWGF